MKAKASERQRRAGRLFWAVFWSTIIVFALVYSYAHFRAGQLRVDDSGRVLVSAAYVDDWKRLLPQVFADMEREFAAAGNDIEALVQRRVDAAFEPVYAQIPAFLDFHYSVVGEYTELAAALSDDAGEHLVDILFTQVDFDQRLQDQINAIDEDSQALLSDLLRQLREQLHQRLALSDNEMTLVGSVAALSAEDAAKRFEGSELWLKGAGAAVGAGAASVLIAKAVGKKMATTLSAKLAAKTAVKAAGLGSGAASGAAAGLLCGPAAWVCAPVGAVVGATALWLATDKVIVEADEYFNREQFGAELRTAIDTQKQHIVSQLIARHQQRLQQVLQHNEAKLSGMTTAEIINQAPGDAAPAP